MKTRTEIIRSLLEPIYAAEKTGTLTYVLKETLYEIYDNCGKTDDPHALSKVISSARLAGWQLPDWTCIFNSILETAQDELLLQHRQYLKDEYRRRVIVTEFPREWLLDFVGSATLADILIKEVKNETSDG